MVSVNNAVEAEVHRLCLAEDKNPEETFISFSIKMMFPGLLIKQQQIKACFFIRRTLLLSLYSYKEAPHKLLFINYTTS